MEKVFVLNVDSDPTALAQRTRYLTSAGFRVAESTCGCEALRISESHDLSLVVLNSDLSDMPGFELCRSLKSKNPDSAAPVLQLSNGHDRDSDHAAALDSGADLYLHNSSSEELLSAAVRSLVSRSKKERRLSESLQRANTDLKEFAYAMSHDLQEPVRMVHNFALLINKRHADSLNEEAREFFHFMLDGAQRMERMIRDLLMYSRVLHEQTAFEEVELREAYAWATSNLETMIHQSSAVVTHDELPRVQGDFMRLSQLFQHLLSNAIKFSGGASPRIHVSAWSDGDHWIIAVSDQGLGMDPRWADKAFGVFRRMHGVQGGGSGVGLAICKRIVERHGGRIWVETAIDTGSSFYFSLPKL